MEVHILTSRSYQWDPVVFDTKEAAITHCVYNEDLLDFVEVIGVLQKENFMLDARTTKQEMDKAFHGVPFDANLVDLDYFLSMLNDDIVYQVGTYIK